jgi:peptidoglycan hydrolase-like protein with peptidoglycan-binding domain
MAKIIKLTESDLEKIIKRVLKEDEISLPEMENVPLGKVEALQQALINAGYNIGPTGAEGVFGKNTRNAVIKYQKDNGIKQTGNVGPVTAGKLGVQPLTSGKPSTQAQTKTTPKTTQTKTTPKTTQTQTKKDGKTSFRLPQYDFRNNIAIDNTYVARKPLPIPGMKSTKGGGLSGGKSSGVLKSGDYLMIIAFPQYEPHVDKGETVSWVEKAAISTQTGEWPREGTYGKIGHAGIALISKTGDVKLFEFGRYNTKKGQGRVISKNLGKIAKIDKSGNFTNTKEVASKVKANTQGDGPRLDMVTAVVPVPNLLKAKAFAEGPAIREYEAVDMSQGGAANCGTFAIDTAKAGGVPIGDFCTPMPVKMVANFKQFSTDYFTV